MTRMAKQVALAVLLAIAAAYAYAQVLLTTDWPTKFRDAANTSSTPVLPSDTMTPAWQIPTPAIENPRVYFTTGGQHVLISGNNIYRASDGTWLRSLPYTARYGVAAITTIGEGVNAVDILLNGDGSHFDAYNLNILLDPSKDPSTSWMWHLDVRSPSPTAKNGVFYLADADDWIAAVDAASGNVLWEQHAGPRLAYGPPAVAEVVGSELVFLTFGDLPGSTCGLRAIRVADGSEAWVKADVGSHAQCCVDEVGGVLYMHNRLNGHALEARDASDGSPIWSAPLDHILNAPPTLGWAKYYPPHPDAPDETLYPAVFAVTGGVDGEAGVYAFRRDEADDPNEQLLWSTTIPSDAHRSAVYCGYTGAGEESPGRLYIATNNNGGFRGYPYFGDTYVLDAFSGQRLRVLGTDSLGGLDNGCPVIVDVGGTPYMYVLTAAGRIVAWKDGGELIPPVYELSAETSPGEISTNASATVTVTLVDAAAGDPPVPVINETIRFSCNAAKNQGVLDPASCVTDEGGIATTTFYSQSRTGVVTVTATGPDGRFAKTTITITKGGGEEPPASGSIQGTVSYRANGKPAKKATVDLWSWEELRFVDTTTTNPRGKYSFQEVPFGEYFVSASTNGATGTTELIEISQSSPSVTSPEGDVYLVEDPAP